MPAPREPRDARRARRAGQCIASRAEELCGVDPEQSAGDDSTGGGLIAPDCMARQSIPGSFRTPRATQ
jgi:hypothetical protein